MRRVLGQPPTAFRSAILNQIFGCFSIVNKRQAFMSDAPLLFEN